MDKKKPFYKIVWFWLFVVACCTTLFFIVTTFMITSELIDSENELNVYKTSSSYSSDSNNYSYKSETSSYSSSSTTAEDPVFEVGKPAIFQSGVIATVDSIEDSNEEPNGTISGHLVKVSFTIENLADEEIRFTGHDFSLYDSERNKAEINAKDFYTESIAKGMKSSGTVYFDAKQGSPYTVIFGAAKWEE